VIDKNSYTVSVVGAGQMGRGICQSFAMSGFRVQMMDVSSEALKRGKEFIENQLLKGEKKEKWDGNFVKTTLSNISLVEDVEGLSNSNIVIEAATENKELKAKIFKNLDRVVEKSCILATNTSSISITELAANVNHPERFVGMHFMNPVPVMKLVEGINGLETSKETFATIKEITKDLGKVLIESRDMPGFVVNRILMPMINEAVFAVYEGLASVEDIDQAMKLGTNQPMGPLTLADFIGLDTCLSIMEVLNDGFKDSKYRPCPLLKQYVLAGRLGRKVGRGFYEY
jgi:3-hydroxybutyryl-CoA dehydrogenase